MLFLSAILVILACLAASVPPAFGDTRTLAVTATVLSRSNCRFDSRTSTLDFGLLNPAVAGDVSASASVDYVCHGSAPVAAFVFTDDNGQNPSGPGARRMRHAAAPEFLPYGLTYSPSSGTVPKNIHRTLTISGTVRWTDFRGSMAGTYTDSVVVSILP
ncbi:MAG TPA: spore coat protein U domain-containing protein [Candidatus Methylomirabilis sp.]|nr:spore coat protein U domain-containing protein [Candidatus Methylomirabilis sp.]